MCTQTRTCSPAELDCVSKVQVHDPSCQEQCEGTTFHVERLYSKDKNEDGAELFLEDYEKYKYPDLPNITFPPAMKGEEVHVQVISPTTLII